MPKKNFAQSPIPKKLSDKQIDAFEKGGTGTDTKAAPVPLKAVDEPMKRLSIDLPQSVHTRFKTACSATGNKMTVEIAAFIESRTRELEEEAGISR